MSEENVALVRDRYARFIGAGENPEEWYDPGFVWDMSTFGGWPEKQHYPGATGMNEFLSTWLAAWDDWRLELDDLRDAGEGRVLAVMRQHGRSKSSGVEVEMHFAQIWTLKGGRYTRMQMYASAAEALEAAGLAP